MTSGPPGAALAWLGDRCWGWLRRFLAGVWFRPSPHRGLRPSFLRRFCPSPASSGAVSGTMRGRATRAVAIRVSWFGALRTERPLQRLPDGAGPWLGARPAITVPGPAAGVFHRRRGGV